MLGLGLFAVCIWCISVGIVAQDNVLFSTSIKENIIYGMGEGHLPTPTDAEIWEVCEKANAKEFIMEFPNLLNTHGTCHPLSIINRNL